MASPKRRIARAAATSKPADRLARWGLASRGGLYILLAIIALLVALGKTRKSSDQQGALALLAQSAIGRIVLGLMVIGFLSYGLWRAADGALGTVASRRDWRQRLESAGAAVAYFSLTISTIILLLHSGRTTPESQRQRTISSRLLEHTGGRVVLAGIGIAVIVVGTAIVVEGVRRGFLENMRVSAMSTKQRRFVETVGLTGMVARGTVFALAGGFVVFAAAERDPAKAGGLDSALRGLAQSFQGRCALVLIAVGLLTFGIFGLTESRWHKTK